MNEIAKPASPADQPQACEVSLHQPHAVQPGDLLSAIGELACRPDLNKDVLAMLIEAQEKAEARQAERAYNIAMSECQGEIAPVAREAQNSHTKSMYAKLEHVDRAIRPIYVKHGFALSFDEEDDATRPGEMKIVCYCSHREGHTTKRSLFAPPDTKGAKGNDVKTELHGRGSTVTFLRRYLTCNVFNVVLKNLDDDGVRGGQRLLSIEQKQELTRLLHETKTDLATWLARVPGTDSLDEIEQGAFVACRNSLLAKRNAMQKKGDAP